MVHSSVFLSGLTDKQGDKKFLGAWEQKLAEKEGQETHLLLSVPKE